MLCLYIRNKYNDANIHQLLGFMVTSELLCYKEPSEPDKTPEIGNLKIRMQALFFLQNHNLQFFSG